MSVAPPVADILDDTVAEQVAETRAHLDAIFNASDEVLAIIDAELLHEQAVARLKVSILKAAQQRRRERETAAPDAS